jgi:hypothetical protein
LHAWTASIDKPRTMVAASLSAFVFNSSETSVLAGMFWMIGLCFQNESVRSATRGEREPVPDDRANPLRDFVAGEPTPMKQAPHWQRKKRAA